MKRRKNVRKNVRNRHRTTRNRILLVEDHAPLAALRCAVLRQQGYAVVLTADGLEACRLLENEAFDLVVTDASLPAGSGWDVARTAKKSRLPVILSTGWPLPPRARDVDYVVRKPSSMTHFLALVHLALQEANSDEAAAGRAG